MAAAVGALLGLWAHMYVAEGWRGSRRLEMLELMLYDAHFGFRAALPPSQQIVIIAIDNDSLRELNTQKISRADHARLLDFLHDAGAAVVGFDLVFDLPSGATAAPETDEMAPYPEPGPDDLRFAAAIRPWGPRVVLAADFVSKSRDLYATVQPVLPLYEFEQAGARWGPVNLPRDTDKVVRRFHVARPLHGVFYASFATQVACQYSRAIPAARISWDVAQWPVDGDNALLINFLGQPRSTTPMYPYYQVLHQHVPPAAFRHKIVLVGATDPLAHDDYPVPLGGSEQEGAGQAAGNMPGVEVQANAVQTLLSGSFLRPVPPLWQALLAGLFGLLGAVGTIALRPTRAAFGVAALTAALGLLAHRLFIHHRVWLWTTMPTLALLVSYVGATVYSWATVERERRRIRSAWVQRAPKAIVDALIHNPELIAGQGRSLTATVLFSDLRGFTTMCHALPPEEVVSMLNEYLERMTAVIHKHRGVIDKFIGDGIMAVFGAPEPDPEHAVNAVRAALEMQQAMARLRAERVRAGREPLYMRIGVHTGELVAGDIGSVLRLEYTHIGDTVSVASRLEELNKELSTEILISGATLEATQGAIAAESLGAFAVRGRAEELQIYRPLGPAGDTVSPPESTDRAAVQSQPEQEDTA